MKVYVASFLAFAVGCAYAGSLDGIGSTRLKGYLGDRLDAMIERHVTGTDVDYLTAPFFEKTERRNCWQTEFWGKYMHSAVPFLKYVGSAKLGAAIDRGVERILSTQEPCGYIGNYPDDVRFGKGWDVWGIKYTMMGLLHYYDAMRRDLRAARALEACRRLCDCVIAEIGPDGKRGLELWQTGHWAGLPSSSILEPVVWLYRRTKDRKYLDFATYVVKGMTEAEAGPRLLDLALAGVSVADRNGYGKDAEKRPLMSGDRRKAYEMMSCYQGILDYVEEVEKGGGGGQWTDDLRLAAIRTAEDIMKEEVNLAGGCACEELWFHGAGRQYLPYELLQETCVTITWMRLCEKLLDMTGDTKWADELERTFYNAYLAALKEDGSEFAAYTPLSGGRYHGHHHCAMHTGCCTANGPRGFLSFLRQFCRRDAKTSTFNFYGSALTDGFEMYSLYPRANTARITSHLAGPLTVRLRVPGWCGKFDVTVNREQVRGTRSGGYLCLDRDWKLGDVIDVSFDMPVVAHVLDRHVAFTRGPVLLARDSRFADGDLSEPLRRGQVRDGQVLTDFAAVRSPSDDIWMAFSATLPLGGHLENPEGALPKTVTFCDYASAGNTWRQDDYYRTWFPIALAPGETPRGWERKPEPKPLPPPVKGTDGKRDNKLEFSRARFGLFLHWGLYSQLGGRWKGQVMPYIGEWTQSKFRIPNGEYAALAKEFNPTKFDADEWARLASEAGMRYVVLTAKHHEGFAMFKSSASDFNIVDATPFGRDVFAELAAACRKYGLEVCFYYSQCLDWHEKDAADVVSARGGNFGMDWGNSWDWPDASEKDLSRYLKAKVYPQLRELLTNYGDVFYIWFDCPFGMDKDETRRLREFVRSLQPDTLVSSRIGKGFGDVGSLGDNQEVAGKVVSLAESPMTINDTWGFKWDDHNWKSGYDIACMVARCSSRNSNVLLNIGPRPDGTLPEASCDVLRELAAWRRKTGYEIYASGAGPFPQDFPWGWCTRADDGTLQFVVKRTWTGDLEICGIRNRVRTCSHAYRQEDELLTVTLPPPDDAMPRVVRLRLEGEPDVMPDLMPQNGVLTLAPAAGRVVPGSSSTAGGVVTGAAGEKFDGRTCKLGENSSLTGWHHPGDTVSWKVRFPKDGRYRVFLRTESFAHSKPWCDDRVVRVSLGGTSREVRMRNDRKVPHTVYARADSDCGVFEAVRGETELVVSTVSSGPSAYPHCLTAVLLEKETETATKERVK